MKTRKQKQGDGNGKYCHKSLIMVETKVIFEEGNNSLVFQITIMSLFISPYFEVSKPLQKLIDHGGDQSNF